MRKALFILLWLLIFASSACVAQSDISLTKPTLEFKDNNVIVVYDILNAKESQTFRISLDISDSLGHKIIAKALSGDVGNNITGGEGKKIYWNLTADNIYIEALLSVKINAEIVSGKEYANVQDSNKSTLEASHGKANPYAGVSRGSVVLQSLLFPGWGLSRINRGPHWLKGIASYGCLASSIVLNSKASQNYSDYLSSTDIDEGNRLYNLSTKQDNISDGLAIAAGGIWLTDLIWTLAGSGKLKNNLAENGISIRSTYNPQGNAPVIAFTYNF